MIGKQSGTTMQSVPAVANRQISIYRRQLTGCARRRKSRFKAESVHLTLVGSPDCRAAPA
jgi:hypothetical protein